MTEEKSVIFAVDDTEKNLGVIAHMFSGENDKVYLFASGKDVLEAIKKITPHLILLDVMMPEMDGYEVCRLLKSQEPSKDIPIIFLTAKMETEDIVEGFRSGGVDYISKPFKKEEVLSRVRTHIALHATRRLLEEALAEKEQLLNETLKGSIKILVDILATTNPDIFAQTIRVRSIARKMAQRLQQPNIWEVEMGVLLSHIACSVIPPAIVNKVQTGKALIGKEYAMYYSYPAAGARFIAEIPRLEKIAESIKNQSADYTHDHEGSNSIEDFIRIVFDYDNHLQSGSTQQQAIATMHARIERYNPMVLGALEAEVRHLMTGFVVRAVRLDELRTGMVLVDNIQTDKGDILVRRDCELSDVMLQKIRNFRWVGRIIEPVKILDLIERATQGESPV